ncbi:MAG TPA: hypothetical protein VIG88_09390 [Lysobacter sp.]
MTFAAAALLFLAAVIVLGSVCTGLLRRVASMPPVSPLELEPSPAVPPARGFAAFSRRADWR